MAGKTVELEQCLESGSNLELVTRVMELGFKVDSFKIFVISLISFSFLPLFPALINLFTLR